MQGHNPNRMPMDPNIEQFGGLEEFFRFPIPFINPFEGMIDMLLTPPNHQHAHYYAQQPGNFQPAVVSPTEMVNPYLNGWKKMEPEKPTKEQEAYQHEQAKRQQPMNNKAQFLDVPGNNLGYPSLDDNQEGPAKPNMWDNVRDALSESIWQVRPHREMAVEPTPNNWVDDVKKQTASKLLPPQNNMQQYINQQVSFLEPSPIQKKINELRKRGETFVDDMFPANDQSLTGEWGYIEKWKSVKWRRISQIINKPVIFDHKVEPRDIKQGQLGNCYFLAALAALAERPERIFNLFLVLEENKQKYYACKLLYKGKWKTIDLDEYIPTIGNKPAFSKAVGQELWVILLEKAWAKLYSSYKRIEAGFGQEGIHDLTGAHMHAIRFQSKGFDAEKEWKYLLHATRHSFCMIASSQPGSDTNQLASGIVMGHAYTFLGAYELQVQGQVVRLVKLRNPWGKGESNGKWSDKDGRWQYVSTEEKRRIGFEGNPDDGIFFMKYSDFIRDFRILNVAQVNDDASYVYHTKHPKKGKGCYFRLTIFKEGKYSLQINQTPGRVYPQKYQKGYKYVTTTLLIGRVEGNNVEYYEGSQSAYRTLFKKHTLKPGEYVVFTKIYFNQKYEMDYEVTLAVYGDYVCQVTDCPEQYIPNFKNKLFMNRARRVQTSKEIVPGIWSAQQILQEGYIYFACWNRSQTHALLRIEVTKNQNPTVSIKKPYKGMPMIEKKIQPKEDFIMLARVRDFSYPTSGIGAADILTGRKK